jgi:acyl carrier protein
MRNTVADQIRNLLVERLFVEVPPEQIGADDSLQADAGLDSLGFVELRVACERHFGVRIEDDDFTPENFRSISRLQALVERLQGAGHGA